MRANLTAQQVADRCGTNAQHVRKLAREGRIPHYRIGGVFRFSDGEIDAWLEASHVTPTGGAAVQLDDSLRERARAIADAMPPLTDAQQAQLAGIFRSARREDERHAAREAA